MIAAAFSFGLALLMGLVAGVVLSYLPLWAIILIALFAICLIILGLIRLSRKKASEENIGMVYGEKGREYESLEPSTFRRITTWLKTH